jgi:hypothetical protein
MKIVLPRGLPKESAEPRGEFIPIFFSDRASGALRRLIEHGVDAAWVVRIALFETPHSEIPSKELFTDWVIAF